MVEEAFQTPKISVNPDEALAVLYMMVDELLVLLLNREPFRTVVVELPEKRRQLLMSCGGLLARLHRLGQQRHLLGSEQIHLLDAAKSKFDALCRAHYSTYIEILLQETRVRIDDYGNFLDDGEADRGYMIDEYAVEMRNRQRLQEVIKELGNDFDDELAERLSKLDNQLRALCGPAAFIWDVDLSFIYPQRIYWYLYIEPLDL